MVHIIYTIRGGELILPGLLSVLERGTSLKYLPIKEIADGRKESLEDTESIRDILHITGRLLSI